MTQRTVSLSNLWMNEDLATQFIAVPIASASCTPSKMSPLKTEAHILPKALHLQNSPVILNSPQRLLSGMGDHSQHHLIGGSPRTPLMSSLSSEPQGAASWPTGHKRIRMTEYDSDYLDSSGKRKKGGEKGGKGLRHFSMKVCEKVQKKGTTSYNEVADELVAEFSAPHHRDTESPDQAYDQKNIRRRVYDALNVLMAMNIISKEKKEIKWLGLPTNSAQECHKLEMEKRKILERMRLKTQQLQDLILQQIAFKNLVERNKTLEKQQQGPPPNSAIQLPFIIVSTNKKTVIDCSISSDKSEYLFTFDRTFEIHDDIEVLKRMGLALGLDRNACSPGDLERARRIVPKALEPYVLQMAQGGGDLPPGLTLSTGFKSYGSISSHHRSNGASTSGADSDAEVAMVTSEANQRLSRQSSVGSSSDLHSRPCTSSPSEDYTDTDSDASSVDEIN